MWPLGTEAAVGARVPSPLPDPQHQGNVTERQGLLKDQAPLSKGDDYFTCFNIPFNGDSKASI